ncbi:MAG: hypothetical protein ACRDJ5_07565 [Actinomycetota bacterium]
MDRIADAMPDDGLAREVGQSVLLIALAGSSVGGLLGIVAVATHVVGWG